MAENAKADNAHAISRLADSSEETIRNLVALPLRMLAGTLGIFEAVLRTAADTLREMDPLDERVVELERRLDSLEEQTTGRRESARATGGSRRPTPGPDAAAGVAARTWPFVIMLVSVMTAPPGVRRSSRDDP
jgi:hypothetical protein